jgi:hypothetical protein
MRPVYIISFKSPVLMWNPWRRSKNNFKISKQQWREYNYLFTEPFNVLRNLWIKYIKWMHNESVVVLHMSVRTLQFRNYIFFFFKSTLRISGAEVAVSIVSDYRLNDQSSIPAEAKDFSSSLCPDQLWCPPSLLSNGYRGSIRRW